MSRQPLLDVWHHVGSPGSADCRDHCELPTQANDPADDPAVPPLQGFVFVNNDPEMVDAQGNHAKARNTNLNEDLGKVSSDPIRSDPIRVIQNRSAPFCNDEVIGRCCREQG